MRIAFVNFEYPPLGGGGGVITKDLAEALSERGHNVFVVTMGYGGLPSHEINGNLSLTRVFSFRKTVEHSYVFSLFSFAFFSLPYLYSLCKKNKVDVINAHFSIPSGISAVIISKMLGIPLVTSAMGADIFDPTRFSTARKFLNIINSYILNNSSKIVCLSSDMKERILTLTKKEIEIIPYGIKREKILLQNENFLRDELRIKDEKIILTVARLVKRKSLDTALKAISLLKEKNHNIKYIIVGDGPEMKHLADLSISLNIKDIIIFAGRVSDEELPFYYSLSNVFLLPSLHEAFGIVLLEAMAFGLPVVASDVGGMKDIVENGKNGFLVSTGNYDDFAEKIELLMLNRDLAESMEKYSLSTVTERFNSYKMVDAYETIYKRVSEE